YRLSPAVTPGKQKRIWIHAVSVGEVRSLKHLIVQLKKIYKNTEIVLTVTTPTG
ncbi:MAG: 3-deoxy-D-manno-octulosonic acid transferase, partial [Candidatus Aminicenantes bacterium]|nr:3-deoxy-D-manno-octulosonic acid transferase [Candidatus Aminicenantes bacterium]NIM82319.1 3-deoxy-D-manno-octulosonic acid transferase [Candidatus Aminicenantes bacterium]NIN21702.1 3-deoxy-D-manno-octulosonic acid transferase [Candidatus Aminicenantes bacterium]NIN45511.1 3-deoxy-D-manno-octulosonic acid transferase [Candidatus Aminicenantes bacterium]NIN88342.1 3-deoxy-D-manno-octulosonic acid transferase [Candidatus Aminicenantes bacterium]